MLGQEAFLRNVLPLNRLHQFHLTKKNPLKTPIKVNNAYAVGSDQVNNSKAFYHNGRFDDDRPFLVTL